MGSPTQQQGFDFESLAAQYLQAQGLTLLARQWRCAFGEIDLIMREQAVLVFVEVRQRKNANFGGAAQSITAAKLAKLERTAALYLAQTNFTGACRFDALLIDGTPTQQHGITAPQCQWLRNISG